MRVFEFAEDFNLNCMRGKRITAFDKKVLVCFYFYFWGPANVAANCSPFLTNDVLSSGKLALQLTMLFEIRLNFFINMIMARDELYDS